MYCRASRRLQMEPSSFAFHNLLHTILLKQKRGCREQSGATHPIGEKSLLPAEDRSMSSIPIHCLQGEQQSHCVPYLLSRTPPMPRYTGLTICHTSSMSMSRIQVRRCIGWLGSSGLYMDA